jgi:hypothetical protein
MNINRFVFYSKRLGEYQALRQKIKKITYQGKNEGCIVFNTVGCYITDLHFEHYLAYLMACDGYRVKILMDDFQLEHWDYLLESKAKDSLKFHKSLKNKILRGSYAFFSRLVFAHPNIEVIHYSKILQKIPHLESPLSQSEKNHAESSVRKYFQSGEMNLQNLNHKRFYDLTLKNCEISRKVAMYIDLFLKPDLYFTSHGFYSVWGPAYDYLKEKNYQALVYYPSPYRAQQLLFYDNTYHYMTQDRDWQNFKNHALTIHQRSTVDEYFKSRFLGKASDTKIYFKGMKNTLALKLDKTDVKCTFALFPNVIWDGDVVERNTVFKGPIQWILETISFFEKNPALHLILRFHPSEATFFTMSRKLEHIIREKVPHLSEIKNITVISSEENVNTYEMIEKFVDVGLVFDGMVGLELTYLKKPVILAAQSRLSGSGVGFEPKSQKEYFDLIKNYEELKLIFDSGKFRENLFRFAYWHLFEHCFTLPILDKDTYAFIRYGDDITPIDPALDIETRKTINYLSATAKRER